MGRWSLSSSVILRSTRAGLPAASAPCRDLFCHHDARPYDGAVPYGDAAHDCNSAAYPHIVLHRYREGFFTARRPFPAVKGVLGRVKSYVGADPYVVPKDGLGAVQYTAVRIRAKRYRLPLYSTRNRS